MYKIEWKQSAVKDLKKLDKAAISKILKLAENLSFDPRPVGCKKLQGSEHLYRARTGKYRIIYSVIDDVLSVEIIRVGHRKDIYNKFTV